MELSGDRLDGLEMISDEWYLRALFAGPGALDGAVDEAEVGQKEL